MNAQKNMSRKPRVHIEIDVETGDAELRRELPFVIGVMGDFSGDPAGKVAPLSERSFKDINKQNFNTILAGMKPRLET